jgi:hypothetical protein
VQRPGRVADVDEAERDVLHRSLERTDAHDVAEGELVLELEEEPGHEVAHETLRAERDGEPHDAGAGEQRTDVEAELPEHEQHRDDDEHGATDAAEQLCRGLRALLARRLHLRAAVVSPLLDPLRDQSNEQPEDERTDDDARDVDGEVDEVVEASQLPLAHRVRTRDALQEHEQEGVHRGKLDDPPRHGQRLPKRMRKRSVRCVMR